MKWQLLVLASITIAAHAKIESQYFDDNRENVGAAADQYLQALGKAVCLVTVADSVELVSYKASLQDEDGGVLKIRCFRQLRDKLFVTEGGLDCGDIKFAGEPAVNGAGTGTLIGDDIVLTAGHNIEAIEQRGIPDSEIVVIFGFRDGNYEVEYDGGIDGYYVVLDRAWYFETDKVDLQYEIKEDPSYCDSYGCRSHAATDWACIKLRTSVPKGCAEPLRIERVDRVSEYIERQDSQDQLNLVIMGYPQGLALKSASQGFIKRYDKVNFPLMAEHTLDTWPGNSGSPIFIRGPKLCEIYKVIGVHSYGGTIRYEKEQNCLKPVIHTVGDVLVVEEGKYYNGMCFTHAVNASLVPRTSFDLTYKECPEPSPPGGGGGGGGTGGGGQPLTSNECRTLCLDTDDKDLFLARDFFGFPGTQIIWDYNFVEHLELRVTELLLDQSGATNRTGWFHLDRGKKICHTYDLEGKYKIAIARRIPGQFSYIMHTREIEIPDPDRKECIEASHLSLTEAK